jgi:ribosome-binding factor A
MTQRQERVSELLKIEISDIIQRELKDPRLGFVTVTGVEVTPDLQHAKVFVSILAEEAERAASMKVLKRASGFVRGELGKRLTLRVTPEIEFCMDVSIERGARIFELLQQIKSDESDKE